MVVAVKRGEFIYQLSSHRVGCLDCEIYRDCKLENPNAELQQFCESTAKITEVRGRRAWARVS